MRSINENLLAAASLISTGNASGSGFLFHSNSKQFLVTARHVLFDEQKDFKRVSDQIEISCPTTALQDLNNRRFRIDMNLAESAFSKDSDIAIVLLGESSLFANTQSYTVKRKEYVDILIASVNNPLMIGDHAVKLIDDVLLSNDVYLFGYPTSLSYLENKVLFSLNRPLLRKGIVSNINKSNNTIILDCAVYPGNSGGPVFEVSETTGQKKFNLIGVVSRYIPFKQEWRNPRDGIINTEYLNSGYSIAIAMDEVLALTKQFD